MRRSKYHSKKIKLDGMIFDSKKEARRWLELKALEQAGEISCLDRQVKYVLIPSQREPDFLGSRGGKKKGKLLEREACYIADFSYIDQYGNEVVEDTKGLKTADYILKRKLMLYVFGIRIKET